MSADAFAAFEEAGLDDEQAVCREGKRFRETVLALGAWGLLSSWEKVQEAHGQ